MTAPEVDEALRRLREPFPPECIGKKPVNVSKEAGAQKSRCAECGGWLPRHQHLDFLGHAHVTDRLLQVDPEWNWEPLSVDSDGLPLIRGARMWIRLTVLGVSRLGVGSVDNGAPDMEKQLISDAIRNAAMRFGVGLQLWAKSDLESVLPDHEDPPPARANSERRSSRKSGDTPDRFHKVGAAKGLTEDERRAIIRDATQNRSTSAGECTPDELAAAFLALAAAPDRSNDDRTFDLADKVADIGLRCKNLPPAALAEYTEFKKATLNNLSSSKVTGWTPELVALASGMLDEIEAGLAKAAS